VLTGASGEVTYSGKALAGMRALVAEPRHRDKVFLVWNTLSKVRPVLPETATPAASVPASLAWMFEGEPVA
jgi:D-cysteine desulfhydrase